MKVNQLKAGAILIYLSQFIVLLEGIVYTPVLLRLLGQSEYGLYQLASSVVSYLSLMGLGLSSSYVRYYSKHKAKDDNFGIAKLNGMYLIVYLIIGILCVIVGSILTLNIEKIFGASLTEDELSSAKIIMALLVFNMSISFPDSIFTSYIAANERFIFSRVLIIIQYLLKPIITLPLLLLGYKSVAVVAVQTLLTLFGFVIKAIYCRRNLGMEFAFKKLQGDIFKEIISFSIWIFLYQIIYQLNWNVDKFILGVFSGTVAVAVYSVAAQINTMYVSLSQTIGGVFVTRINRIVATTNNEKDISELMVKVGRMQFVISGLILTGLVFFGNYFVEIWAGKDYRDAYWIILLLIIPSIVPNVLSVGVEVQRARSKHQLGTIVSLLISVINLIISIPLSKNYGALGAAFGTTIAVFLEDWVIMNVIYQKWVGVDIIYFWKNILEFIPALIAPVIFGVLVIVFVEYNNIFQFICYILLYIVVYFVSMWLLGLNSYEKTLILKPLGNLSKRISR